MLTHPSRWLKGAKRGFDLLSILRTKDAATSRDFSHLKYQVLLSVADTRFSDLDALHPARRDLAKGRSDSKVGAHAAAPTLRVY